LRVGCVPGLALPNVKMAVVADAMPCDSRWIVQVQDIDDSRRALSCRAGQSGPAGLCQEPYSRLGFQQVAVAVHVLLRSAQEVEA
jgi:hypothetical protein